MARKIKALFASSAPTDGDDELQGVRAAETIHGGDGNDTIYGGNTDLHAPGDTMYGDAGDDLIAFSNAPGEVAYGGDGADTFHWGTAAFSRDLDGERDTIGDFNAAEDAIMFPWATTAGATITIETFDATHHRIHITAPGMYDMGIDVIGDAPTLANFVLA